MISAADYADWCHYAGLYLQNHSHAHRYRAYEQKISRQGVFVRVVDDFLKDNKGGIDLSSWRSYNVYEMAGDAQDRINLTADALEAVGASRTAAKVRTVQDTSPTALLMQNMGNFDDFMKTMQEGGAASLMDDLRKSLSRAMPMEAAKMGLPVPGSEPVPIDGDVEPWEEVEHLLNQYVAAHQAALQQDYAKHGDSRQQPGFDPDARMAELEELGRAELNVEFEREDAEKLRDHLRQFEATMRGKGRRKAKSWRKKILSVYRLHSGKPAERLTPPMTQALAEARRTMEQFHELFFPPAIDDAELTSRLAGIGDYNVDPVGRNVNVTWHAPSGLASDFGQFSLHLTFRDGDKAQLGSLLDAIGRLIDRFPERAAHIRDGVLAAFENYADYLSDWELEDYEQDEEGNFTPASILKHAGPGTVHVEVPEWDPSSVQIELFMGVDWDDEHGFEMSLSDES